MSTAKATWDDVKEWAKAEIKAAQTALETAKPDDVIVLQARVKIFRELESLNEVPAKPEVPASFNYTDR